MSFFPLFNFEEKLKNIRNFHSTRKKDGILNMNLSSPLFISKGMLICGLLLQWLRRKLIHCCVDRAGTHTGPSKYTLNQNDFIINKTLALI